MAFALGSFVDGLFSGAKSTMDLLDTKRKMDDAQAVRDATEAARVKANADADAEAAAGRSMTAALGNYGGGGDTGTTGPSTPPPPTEIKEGVTGTRSPTAVNKGAPELVDRIAPLVSKHESSDRPYAGYGGVDLSKAPAKPGFYGFPDWPGVKMPDGTETHAFGLYGFQPDTWKQYAPIAGVNDVSPESQRKVFNAAYLAEGMRPWSRNRALIGDVAAAGLLGGAATSAARAGAPAAMPSALNRDPGTVPIAPSAPPDMEGQRAKAPSGPASNAATTVLKTILGGGTTPAQQANVPEGYATLPSQTSFMTPALSPPSTRSLAPSASAADPVATAAATSALSPTPAATPSSPAPVTVTPPAQRPVLSQLRQMQSDQAAGIRPVFPPDQKFNSRGEAVSQDIGQVLPGQRGMSPSGAVQRSFAAANKIIRLPDGTMVDGIGNVVRQAPSALYPR